MCRRPRRARAPVHLTVALVLAALAAGCAPNKIYRPVLEPCDATGDVRADCADRYVEERPEYVLGFVEFDDQGWFWDRLQMMDLLEHLARQRTDRGLLMVVFIHGWQHNARVCDTNVTCFRETLERLYNIEKATEEATGLPARRVAGIYVGWRGLSATVKGLKQTTFWTRKATAERVGQRGVSELLLRLESLRDQQRRERGEDDSRLVYVGHSFGGAVLYSAVSQLLAERAIDLEGSGAPPKALGDLVVLVNPAFEAAFYEPLWEIGTQRTYFPGQRPVLAILTSKGDAATGKAFPFGRSFSTLFQKHRRSYPGQAPGFQQRSNKTAVGHFEPFFTHELLADGSVSPDQGPYGDPRQCQCPYLPPELSDARMTSFLSQAPPWSPEATEKPPPGWELPFPGSVLHHLPDTGYDPLVPFLNVRVDDSIIHGHSGIYRPVFIDFLRFFISLTMGDSGEVTEKGVMTEPGE